MELTKEQIEFLDMVCYGIKYWKLNSEGKVDVDGSVDIGNMNLTEIPVKFGIVSGNFWCFNNQLTSLKNAPTSVGGNLYFAKNPLTNYFKNIKEEDFAHWDKLDWDWTLKEYPFLINIGKKYIKDLKGYVDKYPQTKIYLE